MSGREKFDAIVIGTGQSGKPLALALAADGQKTAVIEKDRVGGSCINYGCTPTKTMLASARVFHLAQRLSEYGGRSGGLEVLLPKVRERKEEVVSSFRNSSTKQLESATNLVFLRGSARFESNYVVRVEGEQPKTLEGEMVIINTGCRPATPSIEGLEDFDYLTSRTIMDLDEVPEHLLIVGGGYVGCEFGQMFARFSSKVTLIQNSDQLVPREDADVAHELASVLGNENIDLILGSRATAVSGSVGNLTLKVNGKQQQHLRGTHLLIAAGRRPNTDHLGLESTDLETDNQGYIQVNNRLETSVRNVYAVGDVKGGPAFTHISYDDYRVLKANLIEGEGRTISDRLVPSTIFTDPQLASVGLNEKEALGKGIDYRLAKMPTRHVARAIETGETAGLWKALVDPESNRILGCTILSIEAGEIMSLIQVAMLGKLTYPELRDGVFAHPTLAESLNNLFSELQ